MPVGVEDINKIPDARMTASVYQNIFAYPYYGRLNERRGDRWCPKTPYDRSDYLQVDMGAANLICAVATQGMKGSTDRTTSYKLRISLNGVTWKSYTENNVEKVYDERIEQCNHCHKQYTGETKRRLKDRFNEHRRLVDKQTNSSKPTAVSEHFLSNDHNANNMQLIPLELMKSDCG